MRQGRGLMCLRLRAVCCIRQSGPRICEPTFRGCSTAALSWRARPCVLRHGVHEHHGTRVSLERAKPKPPAIRIDLAAGLQGKDASGVAADASAALRHAVLARSGRSILGPLALLPRGSHARFLGHRLLLRFLMVVRKAVRARSTAAGPVPIVRASNRSREPSRSARRSADARNVRKRRGLAR